MKVKIGPYKEWIGPYQIAEFICFWAKKEKDEQGFYSKPNWVYNFGHWLAHGKIDDESEKITDLSELLSKNETIHKTWLYRLCDWIYSKRKRKIYIKIDKWDTWSMDSTLALIILPMLKKLKESKRGASCVDDEDVPEELRSTNALPKENEWDTDSNHFKRWDWVLDEMIFAFDKKNDDDWENSQFDSSFKLINQEEYEKTLKRIKNGFRLFGKYYESLWD
jgi:hypothetical protein